MVSANCKLCQTVHRGISRLLPSPVGKAIVDPSSMALMKLAYRVENSMMSNGSTGIFKEMS